MDEEDSCLTSAAEEFGPAYEPGIQTSITGVAVVNTAVTAQIFYPTIVIQEFLSLS